MPSNTAEIAVEAPPSSNPLDVIPDEIPFDVPYGRPYRWSKPRRLFTPPWQRPRSAIGK